MQIHFFLRKSQKFSGMCVEISLSKSGHSAFGRVGVCWPLSEQPWLMAVSQTLQATLLDSGDVDWVLMGDIKPRLIINK